MTPSTPIEQLRLRARSLHGLQRAKIRTVGQLCQWTPQRLRKIHRFGSKSLEDVRVALAEHGLHLAEPAPAEQTIATHAQVAGGNNETITATHEIRQAGEEAIVAEQWTDAAGAVVSRYEVRLPLALLVHVVLNTTAEERAEIDARADWRGV